MAKLRGQVTATVTRRAASLWLVTAVTFSGCHDDVVLGLDPADNGVNIVDDVAEDAADATDTATENDTTVQGCAADQCDIDGECIDHETAHPDNPCEVCNVVADRLAWTPNDAGVCDDGDACTSDDRCVAGSCTGSAIPCDDANACTADACDASTGACRNDIIDGACPPDDPCAADPPPDCNDGNPCTIDSCESGVGCSTALFEGGCDDNNSCTTGDVCQDGTCVGSGVADCDDGDICTIDSCDPVEGCRQTSVADLCTDDNPCTDETCDPVAGCVFPFNTDACDDGSACTASDACSDGVCRGEPVVVDDGNPCTDDSCDPATGLAHVPNTLPCDNGDVCSVGDVCAGGVCLAGTEALVCDDDNTCTSDACDSIDGCYFTPLTSACDDGTACTESDLCVDGACVGQLVDCEDGNPCTADSCDPVEGCTNTLILSNQCRPGIVVTYPPRAATITGMANAQTVVVTGFVTSGAGAITELLINGQEVPVNPADGSFSLPVTPSVGGNMLVIEATDALGTARRRVQSFLWSTSYRKPVAPKSGMLTEGLGIWLDDQAIDDGDRSLPPNDLGTILELAMQSFDLTSFIPSPAASNQNAGGLVGTYNIFLENLTNNAPTAVLNPIDGGLRLRVDINNIQVDVRARKTCSAGFLSCLGPGTITGDATISRITLMADLMLSVDANNNIVVTVPTSNVTVGNVNIDIDGILGFIVEAIIGGFVDDLVDNIEQQFNSALAPTIAPLLEDAFTALALDETLPLDRLDGTGVLNVDLVTDFAAVDFSPAGGFFTLRAGAYAGGTPLYVNSGIPDRIGCNNQAQVLAAPRADAIELALADGTLNQILYAAWRGGFLEFDVPPSLLGGVDLSAFNIADLDLHLSGNLAPTASDCAAGDLEMHIGDVRVDASMTFFGQPLDVVVWLTFGLGVEVAIDGDELGVSATELTFLESEVSVAQEPLIAAEETIRTLIEDELVGGIVGALTGTQLGSFPLPDVDLSGAISGLPPGTSFSIQPSSVTRAQGNTIVGGALQ